MLHWAMAMRLELLELLPVGLTVLVLLLQVPTPVHGEVVGAVVMPHGECNTVACSGTS